MIFYVQYLAVHNVDQGEYWATFDRAWTTPECNWTTEPKWLYKTDEEAADAAQAFAARLAKYHTYVRVVSKNDAGRVEVVQS